MSLHHVLFDTADRLSTHIGGSYGDVDLSWREISQLVNRFAARLDLTRVLPSKRDQYPGANLLIKFYFPVREGSIPGAGLPG